MSSVLKLRVCHFSYFTLVTEGALIIFFLRKKQQGALIGAGALNGANTVFRFELLQTLSLINVLVHLQSYILPSFENLKLYIYL